MLQLPLKTVWEFLKTLKIELPYDPAIQLLGVYTKELKEDLKEIFMYQFFSIHNSQKVEAPQVSTNR